MSVYKILFGISGSISAYKALTTVSALTKAGHEVQCIGTTSSLNFIGAATVEGLTGKPFLTDSFTTGHMMDHIHLARWAEVFVIAPASANTIARLAHGFAEDPISALSLAAQSDLPILLAPAMNPQMWNSPAVKENIQKLQIRGVRILNPGSGRLACGETGEGRLIEPLDLEASILDTLGAKATKLGKILITSGGTTEPIDSVRSITNTSTGRTGAILADELSNQGFDVHLIRSRAAVKPNSTKVKVSEYLTFTDLEAELKNQLQNHKFTALIHAAAVSDYHVASVLVDNKIVAEPKIFKLSTNQDVAIRLAANPKLIDHVKSWSSNPDMLVIGFKLTDESSTVEQIKKVTELFSRSNSDYVVQNDLSQISKDNHSYQIFDKNLNLKKAPTTLDLAHQIGEIL